MVKTCHKCHGLSGNYEGGSLRRCAGCHKVYYCSTTCQKDDWVCHIFDCKPRRPINTADYLALAVHQNELPVHFQTLIDYGFVRAYPPQEKEWLLGLYTDLMKEFEIPSRTIHDWRVRGVLADEIKAAYYKIPEGRRGDYFYWFLQNEHVVAQAGQILPIQTLLAIGDEMFLRAWTYAGGSERDSPNEIAGAIARKPDKERSCYWLCGTILCNTYISPRLAIWVKFGFATCTSREDEIGLCSAYQRLITQCTFKEFCDAYRTYRLLDLFDSKGIQVKHRDHLRDLLQGSGEEKSVWYLKQSIVLDCIEEESAVSQSVKVDYGFANCRKDSERRQLMRVYKAFFDKHNGDPLTLHEAAMKGNIHGYLSKVVQGLRDAKFQRLMKNPYPLQDL